MKLAVVSHSLVAERQSWFFDWLGTQPGVEVMKVAPNVWGNYSRTWGYPVVHSGNMTGYEFEEDAFTALDRFKPDVIYVQQEAYCRVTGQMIRWAKRSGAKLALFVWDNITNYDQPFWVRNILHDCDLVVCGNYEAEALVRQFNPKVLRCIQVGVPTDVFVPLGRPVKDVIFQGRMAEEKGYKVLQRADGRHFSILWPQPNQGSLYADLVVRYNDARVIAAPSIDTPTWKEQHAGYATLEALSCGLYAVTTNSACIVDSLLECPGCAFVEQNDASGLRDAIVGLLRDYRRYGKNLRGREWVIEHYGYEAIGKTLLEAFRKL